MTKGDEKLDLSIRSPLVPKTRFFALQNIIHVEKEESLCFFLVVQLSAFDTRRYCRRQQQRQQQGAAGRRGDAAAAAAAAAVAVVAVVGAPQRPLAGRRRGERRWLHSAYLSNQFPK